MRKLALLLIAAASAGASFTASADLPNDHRRFAWFDFYGEANDQIGLPKEDERRVVFMGNSITQNWASMRPEFFSANGYIGRGIGGQTSYQYLLRFREDVVNLRPEIVVINFGTNDIAENTGAYDEDITFGNLQSMVEIARANGIDVILTSCLPSRSMYWNPNATDSMKKIRSLNARTKAYAEANGYPYVDYFTPLLATDGEGMSADFSKDGVHPEVPGYEIMENLVIKAIDSVKNKNNKK